MLWAKAQGLWAPMQQISYIVTFVILLSHILRLSHFSEQLNKYYKKQGSDPPDTTHFLDVRTFVVYSSFVFLYSSCSYGEGVHHL